MTTEERKRVMRSQATRKVETQIADTYAGGRRVSQSGARAVSAVQQVMARVAPFGKVTVETDGADVVSEHYVIDSKRTEGKSVAFSRAMVGKIRKAAARHHKIPVIQITFTLPIDHPGYHQPKNQDHWVCIPKSVFDALDRAYHEDEGVEVASD